MGQNKKKGSKYILAFVLTLHTVRLLLTCFTPNDKVIGSENDINAA